MNSGAQAREILDDARAYVDARALSAAAELISDSGEALRRHVPALSEAVELLNACYYGMWEDGSPDEAAGVLELIFRLARGRLFDDRGVDPEVFDRYQRALVLTGNSPIPLSRYHRHQNLIRVFSLTQNVTGDVVECGCARGLSSLELCMAIGATRSQWCGAGYHVFDSFEGLSEPRHEDLDLGGMKAADAARIQSMMRRGNMAFPLEQVQAVFLKTYPDVAFHPGWIPESFAGLPEREYRFVHVDVDLYQPTLDAFRYFFPRLAPGGVLATDDYNWPGARKAVDEFCAASGVQAQTTNTNQAYLIRAS